MTVSALCEVAVEEPVTNKKGAGSASATGERTWGAKASQDEGGHEVGGVHELFGHHTAAQPASIDGAPAAQKQSVGSCAIAPRGSHEPKVRRAPWSGMRPTFVFASQV